MCCNALVHKIDFIMRKNFLLILLTFGLAACSSVPRFTSRENANDNVKIKEKNNPSADENDFALYANVKPLETISGIASYYSYEFNGRKTSDGEIYDMNKMTAAEPDLPFNSIVRVVNTENHKSVLLRINDRGPLKKGRIIDVSYAAAKKLGMISKGTANVLIEVLRKGNK